jgi:hypothetical protein
MTAAAASFAAGMRIDPVVGAEVPARDHGSDRAMNSTARIRLGLALGVAVGIFLGERAEPFRLVAEAFVRLLQMTVMPCVTVSLTAPGHG